MVLPVLKTVGLAVMCVVLDAVLTTLDAEEFVFGFNVCGSPY